MLGLQILHATYPRALGANEYVITSLYQDMTLTLPRTNVPAPSRWMSMCSTTHSTFQCSYQPRCGGRLGLHPRAPVVGSIHADNVGRSSSSSTTPSSKGLGLPAGSSGPLPSARVWLRPFTGTRVLHFRTHHRRMIFCHDILATVRYFRAGISAQPTIPPHPWLWFHYY